MKDLYEGQCYHCAAIDGDQPHEMDCRMNTADEPAELPYERPAFLTPRKPASYASIGNGLYARVGSRRRR